MSAVGRLKHERTLVADLLGSAVMHVCWRQQAQPRVVVLIVVPVEEIDTETTRIFDAAEAFWKVRPVLERLELGFRIRVVVRNVRA